jgi:hypothetical protein
LVVGRLNVLFGPRDHRVGTDALAVAVLPDATSRVHTDYDYRERRGSATAGRVLKAIRLDSFFYSSVAENPDRGREAVLLAFASSLIMGLGLMLMRIVHPIWWLLGGIAWAAALLFGGSWYLVSVGRRLGGSAAYDQMLRPLGYAMVPQALGFVPLADFIPGFLIGVSWSTACAVVAVREAHRVPTRLAVALVVAPILVAIGLAPLVAISLTGGG